MDVLLTTLFFLAHIGLAQGGAKLTLEPPILMLTDSNDTGTVKINCSLTDNIYIKSIVSFTLQRILSGGTRHETLGEIKLRRGKSETVYNKQLPKISVAGDVTLNQPLMVTLGQTGCMDEGTYTCLAAYTTQGMSQILQSEYSGKLVIRAGPGQIEMTAVPDANAYPIGTKLQLRCRAPLGSVYDYKTQTIEWIWQFKDNTSSSWTRYYGLGQTSEPFTQQACETVAVGTLTRDVNAGDAGMTYMCFHSLAPTDPSRFIAASRKLEVEPGPTNRLTLSEVVTPQIVGREFKGQCWIRTNLTGPGDPAEPYPLSWSLSSDPNLTSVGSIVNAEPVSEPPYTMYVTNLTFTLQMRHHGAGLACQARFGQYVITTRATIAVSKSPDPPIIIGPQSIETTSTNTWTCSTSGASETPSDITWSVAGKTASVDYSLTDRTSTRNMASNGLIIYAASSTLTLYTPLEAKSFVLKCVAVHNLTKWEKVTEFAVTVVDKNDCVAHDCRNGASCKDKVNAYSCICAPGYTGIMCEIDIDNCVGHLCQNGAVCVDRVNAYDCRCWPGFRGWLCEIDIDECLSKQCQNGATCVQFVNGYKCQCDKGYTGLNCETDIDECSLPIAVCRHGGTCRDMVAGYNCLCPPGYVGPYCDIEFDDCSVNPCRNGASCEDRFNDYNCVCPSGYMGKDCESEMDECRSSPCKNGGGCTDRFNGYDCTCRNGYGGRTCQLDRRVHINFSPPIVTTHTSEARVDVLCCAPPDVEANQLFELTILRSLKDKSRSVQTLARMIAGRDGTGDSSKDSGLRGGSVSLDANKKCMTYTMRFATCADDGQYTCRAVYDVVGYNGTQMVERGETLTIRLLPGPVITEIVEPSSGPLVENSALVMACTDAFPLAYKTPKWRWEIKSSTSKDWVLLQPPTHKIQTQLAQPLDECRQIQTSRLSHDIKYADEGAKFRCYVTQDDTNEVRQVGEFVVGKVIRAVAGTGNPAAQVKNNTEFVFSWRTVMVGLGMYAVYVCCVIVTAALGFGCTQMMVHYSQAVPLSSPGQEL